MLSFLVLPLRRMFLLLFYFCVHVCSVVFDSLRPYVAHQSPLSMGFSRQEYWSGLPCPPPGNLPDPGIKPLSPASPALQADSLTLSHWGLFYFFFTIFTFKYCKYWLLVSKRNFKSYHCCCSVAKLCPIIHDPLWLSWWRICLRCRIPGFDPWVGKTPWRRESLPTPVFWPGETHGLYCPRGHKESNMTGPSC